MRKLSWCLLCFFLAYEGTTGSTADDLTELGKAGGACAGGHCSTAEDSGNVLLHKRTMMMKSVGVDDEDAISGARTIRPHRSFDGQVLNVAIYMQLGLNTKVPASLLRCVRFVSEAAIVGRTDVFLSSALSPEQFSQASLADQFSNISVDDVEIDALDNIAADVGLFFGQVDLRMRNLTNRHYKESYDVGLKLHAKSDEEWMDRMLASLCGSAVHVDSILKRFHDSNGMVTDRLSMVAAHGFLHGVDAGAHHIWQGLHKRFGERPAYPAAAFDPSTLDHMRSLYTALKQDFRMDRSKFNLGEEALTLSNFPNGEKGPNATLEHDSLVLITASSSLVAAGNMFWFHHSTFFKELPPDRIYPIVRSQAPGYTKGSNGHWEHVFERFAPTYLKLQGYRVETAIPAVLPLALYFPQYHRDATNDMLWGENFTEWTLLKPSQLPGLRKPLMEPNNPHYLGYYDLLNATIRERQVDLARRHGVGGFVYYHYWFAGSKKVLYKVPEFRLTVDRKLNFPFALSWANEPWTRTWTGNADETVVAQDYGSEEDWLAHIRYLVQFFKHPDYIWVDGKHPLFIIYRSDHIPPHVLSSMVGMWHAVLKAEHGISGLHLVETIGNFGHFQSFQPTEQKTHPYQGCFHFWPQLAASIVAVNLSQDVSSTRDFDALHCQGYQYWGAYTGFDRRVRSAHPSSQEPKNVSIAAFELGLRKMFQSMGSIGNHDRPTQNFLFLTAWNEWNEQAVLEPDDVNRFGFLNALHDALVDSSVR